MDKEITRIVSFFSKAFNTTESKSYFINPCCFETISPNGWLPNCANVASVPATNLDKKTSDGI